MFALVVILIVVAIFTKRRWRKGALIAIASIFVFYALAFSFGALTFSLELTPVKTTTTIHGTYKTSVTSKQHASPTTTPHAVTPGEHNVVTTAAKNVVTSVAP